MYLCDSLISRVSFDRDLWVNMYFGFLEQPEIMPSSLSKSNTDNMPVRFFHHNLCL